MAGAHLTGRLTERPTARQNNAPPACIWMQAGVVKFKNCDNYYDCTTCKYDTAMSMKADRGKQMTWQQAMRRMPDMDRVCRHSLTNRIERRACAYDYQCATCDFDQYFEDVWTTKSKSMPGEVQQVKGFDVPMDFYFHDGHAWARIESGGYIRIGLDDFALKVLGKADALELPLMGKELDQGKVGWGLKRKDNLADVLSPIDGVIVEVNSELREKPDTANREPYGDGWLFMVRTPDVKATMKKLMIDQSSLSWMNNEVTNLESMIEDGTIHRYTKKEALKMEKDLLKLKKNLDGIKDMDELPGAIFIIDPKRRAFKRMLKDPSLWEKSRLYRNSEDTQK